MSAHARRAAGGGSPSTPEVAPQVEAARPASQGAARPPKEGAETESGPFAAEWLNDALTTCFDEDLSALDATMGDEEANQALGAEAHTQGTSMSFGAEVKEDAADAGAMEVIGHEVAHALAGGGAGATALDGPQDAGETKADEAGKRFSSWVQGGMKQPPPRLKPAAGGQAEVHRKADVGTTWAGTPMLQEGSRGDNVRQLQAQLNAHGAGIVTDGVFGPQTKAAVVNFQRAHGLIVDGVAGPQTANALKAPSAPAPAPAPAAGQGAGTLTGEPPLKIGSKGAQVRALQTLLNQRGQHVVVDGDFGPQTDGAVKAYQAANGLLVDGVVGPRTAAKLNGGQDTAQPAPTPAAPAPAAPSTRLTGTPALRMGSKGDQVKVLQGLLNGFGGHLTQDGDFGRVTDAAVRGFQTANHLTVDGVVGPQTAAKLYDSAAKDIVAVTTQPAPATGGRDKSNADPGNKLSDSRFNPTVRALARETIADTQASGLFPYVTETYRSFEDQNLAYDRGTSQARAGQSWHNYGLAVDIAFWNPQGTGPTWSPANPNDWQVLGAHGKRNGFTAWGGDWGWDMVHFEYHPEWASSSAGGLLSTYNSGGLQAVWERAT